MEKHCASVQNFWNRHKGKIAVVSTVTAVGAVALVHLQGRSINEFLEEEGLTDKYYNLALEDL